MAGRDQYGSPIVSSTRQGSEVEVSEYRFIATFINNVVSQGNNIEVSTNDL